jgi:hypothetical protein
MGKWLWKKINAALESYTTAYANGQAAIDVRIRNLEKLAEEQARLTRTVESIKDEIAAGAKSRDNRWAFKKEIYYNLINVTSDLAYVFQDLSAIKQCALDPDFAKEPLAAKLLERRQRNSELLHTVTQKFVTYSRLAPLATADSVSAAILNVGPQHLSEPLALGTPAIHKQIQGTVNALTALLTDLQAAGRKDLWGDPELEPKAVAATQNT